MRRDLIGALIALAIAIALAAGSGCNAALCARHSDCGPAQMCTREGACTARPIGDGGATDGAAPVDARPDASPDAPPDAASPDAAAIDAMTADAAGDAP